MPSAQELAKKLNLEEKQPKQDEKKGVGGIAGGLLGTAKSFAQLPAEAAQLGSQVGGFFGKKFGQTDIGQELGQKTAEALGIEKRDLQTAKETISESAKTPESFKAKGKAEKIGETAGEIGQLVMGGSAVRGGKIGKGLMSKFGPRLGGALSESIGTLAVSPVQEGEISTETPKQAGIDVAAELAISPLLRGGGKLLRKGKGLLGEVGEGAGKVAQRQVQRWATPSLGETDELASGLGALGRKFGRGVKNIPRKTKGMLQEAAEEQRFVDNVITKPAKALEGADEVTQRAVNKTFREAIDEGLDPQLADFMKGFKRGTARKADEMVEGAKEAAGKFYQKENPVASVVGRSMNERGQKVIDVRNKLGKQVGEIRNQLSKDKTIDFTDTGTSLRNRIINKYDLIKDKGRYIVDPQSQKELSQRSTKALNKILQYTEPEDGIIKAAPRDLEDIRQSLKNLAEGAGRGEGTMEGEVARFIRNDVRPMLLDTIAKGPDVPSEYAKILREFARLSDTLEDFLRTIKASDEGISGLDLSKLPRGDEITGQDMRRILGSVSGKQLRKFDPIIEEANKYADFDDDVYELAALHEGLKRIYNIQGPRSFEGLVQAGSEKAGQGILRDILNLDAGSIIGKTLEGITGGGNRLQQEALEKAIKSLIGKAK